VIGPLARGVPSDPQDTQDYKDYFAWENQLLILEGKKPIKHAPRRFTLEVTNKIKEEIEQILEAKFIQTIRHVN